MHDHGRYTWIFLLRCSVKLFEGDKKKVLKMFLVVSENAGTQTLSTSVIRDLIQMLRLCTQDKCEDTGMKK